MTTRRRKVRDRKAWRRFRRRGLRRIARFSKRLEADLQGMRGALGSVLCALRDFAAAVSQGQEAIPANPTASSAHCDKHCDTGPVGPEVTNA